jgi:hypothetical protein
MAPSPPDKFKRAKAVRKRSPGKRVVVSDDARKAYEETIRLREARAREHDVFLPDDLKGKR